MFTWTHRIHASGAIVALLAIPALAQFASAQMGGGSVYKGQQGNPADILRQQRALSDQEIPPTTERPTWKEPKRIRTPWIQNHTNQDSAS